MVKPFPRNSNYSKTNAITQAVLPHRPSLLLLARQSGSTSCNCISGGSIAGIVIGTILGTLLILWLFNSTRGDKAPVDYRAESEVVGKDRRERTRGHERRGSHSSYSKRGSRVREPERVYYKSSSG